MPHQLIPFTHAAGGALIVFLGWRAFARSRKPIDGNLAIDLALAFAALTLLQWPFILSLNDFNPDEAQALAQAMRYLDHPLPWRDVDGNTCGPLNSWVLSFPLLLGAPLSLATTRVVRLILLFVVVAALALAMRRVIGGPRTRIAMLPIVCFLAWAHEYDFVHYSSETLPLALLSVAAWMMAPSLAGDRPTAGRVFVFGLVLGAVPFTKLQAAPMAVFLWGLHAFVLMKSPSFSPRKLIRSRLAALLAGALVVPAAILGSVFASGSGDDFLTSYFVNNFVYMAEKEAGTWATAWKLLTESRSFAIFVAMFVVAASPILWSAAHTSREPAGSRLAATAGAAWLVLSIYCVVAPGWVFAHYLLLLVGALPIAIVIVAGLAGGRAGEASPPVRARGGWAIAQTVVLVTLAILAATPHYVKSGRDLRHGKRESMRIAHYLSPATRPGDEIAVWGWMPSLYVDSGCAPATRDSVCHFVIQPGVLQPYYQQRHLGDLVRSMPPVFVDAAVTGAFLWPGWPADVRHETFPELSRFVDSRYQLWRVVPSADPLSPYRIYVSSERMQAAGLEPLNSEPSALID